MKNIFTEGNKITKQHTILIWEGYLRIFKRNIIYCLSCQSDRHVLVPCDQLMQSRIHSLKNTPSDKWRHASSSACCYNRPFVSGKAWLSKSVSLGHKDM